ncbi:MAG: hypothetical protein ABI811_17150 [Acidobacteriota bacterium]
MTKFLKIARNLVLLATAALLTTSMANAQVLPKAELKKLIASAGTPQDHEKLAKHYDAKATQYEADAKEHEELAAEYTASGNVHAQKHPMMGLTAEHCKTFAASSRKAAVDARQVAADHRAMAKPAK